MTQHSYWEQAQHAYFRAARELRGVAGQVLDDMQNDAELTSDLSHEWAKDRAKTYAEQATAMEAAGYALGSASTRAESALRKSRGIYSAQIDNYEARRKAALARA